jgi:hypothetical protein
MRFRSLAPTAACTILIATAALADGPVSFAYRDARGNVHDFHFDGKAWQKLQLNNGGMTVAPVAVSDPIPLQGRDQQLHCAYRDISGNLHHLRRVHFKWAHDQLNNGGATAAPPAAGDPAGTVQPGGQLDFVYRDQEGGLSGAPAAASDPWIHCGPGPGGTIVHVFYRDGQGNLQHWSCLKGKWSGEVVNTGTHVTMAPPAGRLKCY